MVKETLNLIKDKLTIEDYIKVLDHFQKSPQRVFVKFDGELSKETLKTMIQDYAIRIVSDTAIGFMEKNSQVSHKISNLFFDEETGKVCADVVALSNPSGRILTRIFDEVEFKMIIIKDKTNCYKIISIDAFLNRDFD